MLYVIALLVAYSIKTISRSEKVIGDSKVNFVKKKCSL